MQLDSTDPISILKELVAIPSQNPMGKRVEGNGWFEHRVTNWIVKFLKELKLEVFSMDCGDGRCNVLCTLPGRSDSPHYLFDAHQDTVPVEGMTIDPFNPKIESDRLYGRGSCDVKGGMAAMMAAFVRLSELPMERRATVTLCCSCDEELNQLGMIRLMKDFDSQMKAWDWCKSLPDRVIVAEPTDLDVVVAHMGVTRWKIHVPGTSAHSSDPTRGVNAIYRMARLISCVEAYAKSLQTSNRIHPLCGGPSLSVGVIEGGTSVNVIPNRCTIEIDRRVAPGESCDEAIEELRSYLSERIDFPFDFEPPWCKHNAFPDDVNRELAEQVSQIAKAVSQRGAIKGVRFGTHATNFSLRGIPTIVFGPGSIQQAHTVDEWVSIEQLCKASDVYFQLASL